MDARTCVELEEWKQFGALNIKQNKTKQEKKKRTKTAQTDSKGLNMESCRYHGKLLGVCNGRH